MEGISAQIQKLIGRKIAGLDSVLTTPDVGIFPRPFIPRVRGPEELSFLHKALEKREIARQVNYGFME